MSEPCPCCGALPIDQVASPQDQRLVLARAIADGFTNGYEQYDEATEAQRFRYDMAADAVLSRQKPKP